MAPEGKLPGPSAPTAAPDPAPGRPVRDTDPNAGHGADPQQYDDAVLEVALGESDRQLCLLALAVLALSRPGFDVAIGAIAERLNGRMEWQQFKRFASDCAREGAGGFGLSPGAPMSAEDVEVLSLTVEMVGLADAGRCMACGGPLGAVPGLVGTGCVIGKCAWPVPQQVHRLAGGRRGAHRWAQRSQVLVIARRGLLAKNQFRFMPGERGEGLPSGADLDADAAEKKLRGD